MQDEQDIPLLRDVVDPDEIVFNDDSEPAISSESTDQQEIIDVIREGIAVQLNEELQPTIIAAINSAVDQATGELRQIMLDELQGSLQNRIRLLIDGALDKQFGE
ncbi:MAG: hypothetical protein ABFS39_12025 [Pseudomonadota bacterium]